MGRARTTWRRAWGLMLAAPVMPQGPALVGAWTGAFLALGLLASRDTLGTGLALAILSPVVPNRRFEPLIVGVVAGLVVFGVLLAVRRRLLASLRSVRRRRFASPDARVAADQLSDELYRRGAAAGPNVTVAFVRAQIFALYGDGDAAREELAPIPWDRSPLELQALGIEVEGLIHLLCGPRPAAGLDLARRARTLVAPLRGGPLETADALLAIAEGICGVATDRTRVVLETWIHRHGDPLARVDAAFALRVASHQAGDRQLADAMARLLADEAPHCRPLHADPAAVLARAAADPDLAAMERPPLPDVRREPKDLSAHRQRRIARRRRQLRASLALNWAIIAAGYLLLVLLALGSG